MGDASKYSRRGVSSSKKEVHAALTHVDKGLFPGAFCKINADLLGGQDDYVNMMHADGAGTKSSLAYLYWKETGDLSVWEGIAQDAIVMNTDDLFCTGCTGPMLLSSTIGRNRKKIPGEVIAALINGTESFLEKLRHWGIEIRSTGGETADVGDLVRTIIVDSTVTARMKKGLVIDNSRIQAGDVIVGLASFGKAGYEDVFNSGIGSNGLTSARHEVLHHEYATLFPESFDPAIETDLVYSGSRRLTEVHPEGNGLNTGQLLLSPTRTYAPLIVDVLQELRPFIHGMVHCSGGGQTKVLHFTKNLEIIKDHLFPTPYVFRMIQQESGTSWEEMYAVFNMGHRLECYLPQSMAGVLISLARHHGIDAQVVGYCRDATSASVAISSVHGTFVYR